VTHGRNLDLGANRLWMVALGTYHANCLLDSSIYIIRWSPRRIRMMILLNKAAGDQASGPRLHSSGGTYGGMIG